MASAAAEKLKGVSDPAERQHVTAGMITTIAGRTQQLATELEAAGVPDVAGGAQIATELAAAAAADAQGYREYATLYAALDAVDLDAGSRRIEATMKPKAQAAYEQATAALKRDPAIATLTAQNTGCQAAFNAVD